MYKYALKIIKLPKNDKKMIYKRKNSEKFKKMQNKVSLLKYLLHESNYAFGMHCFRALSRKATLH